MAAPTEPHGTAPPAGASRSGRPSIGALVALVGLFAVYAATFGPASDGQLLGNDAIPYAGSIASGARGEWLLANHLLPHVAAAVLHGVGAKLGLLGAGMLGAIAAEQLVSAAAGATAVVLLAAVARRLSGSKGVGVAVGAVFACAAAPWLYAAVGETYLPAAAVEAWLVLETLRLVQGDGSRARLAAAAAIAVLVREDAVFALLVPLVALRTRAVAPLAAATVAATVVFALAYALSPPTRRSRAGCSASRATAAGARAPSAPTSRSRRRCTS
ncbi:MAG: hypothetical protein R3F34_13620 [Planctomycetota bacterium]